MMELHMELRLILLSFMLDTAFELFATYDDYGRDYSMREESTRVPLWFVVVMIIGIWILYKIFYGGISKLDDISKSKKNKVHRNVPYQYETTAKASLYPVQHICTNCSGTGWDSVLQDITYLRKKCCKCEGRGFIASHNYITTQLRINDIEKRISNQFDNYINLLSNKLKKQIELKKKFYISIGEEYLEYDEALIRVKEVSNKLKASRSYKILHQLYKNETQDYCKNPSKFTSSPRFCYRLLSCDYCMMHKCKMSNLLYKKLKILYNLENKKLIDEYVHLIAKYSEYLKLDDRKKYGNQYIPRPFDKWMKKFTKEKSNLLQLLEQERKTSPKCETCNGEGFLFDEPNLVIGQSVIVKKSLFLKRYYMRKICSNCKGKGFVPNN